MPRQALEAVAQPTRAEVVGYFEGSRANGPRSVDGGNLDQCVP
jgi:hypothetical protein